MNEQLLDDLLTLRAPEAWTPWLDAHLGALPPAQIDALVEALKGAAVQLRMSDPAHGLAIAALIAAIAQRTGVPLHQGYSLWAAAVVTSLGKGDYTGALALYDEAIAIFTAAGDGVSPAIMQVSRIWSLANLNRTGEALAAGAAAAQVLHDHGRWLPLATLQMNIASIYTRLGEYGKALAMYEEQQRSYASFGLDSPEIEGLWALAVHNCAIALCYLGRFGESIAASQAAHAAQVRLGNGQEAARVQQHLAVTYVILGRYNEALRLFDAVRTVFAAGNLPRHAARVDLYMCECFLRLRRFDRVIAKTPHIQAAFAAAGAPHEQGIAALYAAMARAGEGEVAAALHALADARTVFAAEGSTIWIAHCDLLAAQMHLLLGDAPAALAAARTAAGEFEAEDQRVKVAEARLAAARALAAQDQEGPARAEIARVAALSAGEWAPDLLYQMHSLEGALSRRAGDLDRAFTELDAAIAAVEHLRAHLMIDLRVSFQEDKETVYADMVEVCLARGDATLALNYADRAKSRTLVELLDGRIEVRLAARSAADQPLVDELLALRAQRDQLCRHRQNREQGVERGLAVDLAPAEAATLAALEQRIAELWDALLIRSAAYAEDAGGQVVAPRPLDLTLREGEVLVEYFATEGRLLAFVVAAGAPVHVRRLDATLDAVRPLVERLHQHMRAVHRFPPSHLPALTGQAQFLLGQLHGALLAPLVEDLAACTHVLVVPHGVLHYVPFHALYDGSRYVAERWAVSYLPNAALRQAAQWRTATRAPAPNNHNPSHSNPGHSSPGHTSPSHSSPGHSNPGHSSPGSSDPASRGPGHSTPGQSDPASSDPASSDPASSDPASSDPASSDPASRDPGLMLALGYSAGGTLPHAAAEAGALAALAPGPSALLLEQDATRAALAAHVRGKRIVHLATHGEYHDDQPLFSGLLLADGWLTTLDVFDLPLTADLVTLSACQSGRSTLGGGDELLGLTRAFFHAGAASLLISMWSVEDRATRQWMEVFYTHLLGGCSKAEAIRRAQQAFLRAGGDLRAGAATRAIGDPAESPAESPAGGTPGAAEALPQPPAPPLNHPYFWAPFFLIGDTVALDPAALDSTLLDTAALPFSSLDRRP